MANRKEERRNNNNENRTEAEVLDVAFRRAINTKKNKNKIMKLSKATNNSDKKEQSDTSEHR